MKLLVLSAAFGLSWAYALPWRLGMWYSRIANILMFCVVLFLIGYVLFTAEPIQP